MSDNPLIFAYFSPDTYLPLTSVIATVVGVVMMFGKNTFRLLASAVRLGFRRPERATTLKGPHVRLADRARTHTAVPTEAAGTDAPPPASD